jgi:hypothetical protein
MSEVLLHTFLVLISDSAARACYLLVVSGSCLRCFSLVDMYEYWRYFVACPKTVHSPLIVTTEPPLVDLPNFLFNLIQTPVELIFLNAGESRLEAPPSSNKCQARQHHNPPSPTSIVKRNHHLYSNQPLDKQ